MGRILLFLRKFRSHGKHVYDHSWSYDQMLNLSEVSAYLTSLEGKS